MVVFRLYSLGYKALSLAFILGLSHVQAGECQWALRYQDLKVNNKKITISPNTVAVVPNFPVGSKLFRSMNAGQIGHQVILRNGGALLSNGPGIKGNVLFTINYKNGADSAYALLTGPGQCDLNVPEATLATIKSIQTSTVV